MSQKKRNKDKAEKEDNCKEEKEPPYDVIIAIDEDERKVEGVVRGGNMPKDDIPSMISDFIMHTAMPSIDTEETCPYDLMNEIDGMVSYIASGFAAIAGVRHTGGNARAVGFINDMFHDFRKNAYSQIVLTPYGDKMYGTQYHIDVYGSADFFIWKALLAFAQIADEKMKKVKGLNVPSLLIACNVVPTISNMIDEIMEAGFDCSGMCDECPVSGNEGLGENVAEEDGLVFGGHQGLVS